MKKTIISIFGILYLSLSTLNAQNIEHAVKMEILVKDIDKMNKKDKWVVIKEILYEIP